MRALLVTFGVLPFLAAAATVFLGIRVRSREGDLRRIGVRVVGTIVDSREEADKDGLPCYRPLIEFQTERRRRMKVVGTTVSPRAFPTGTAVAVVYDPQKPDRFVTGPAPALPYFVAAGVFAAFGVGMVFVVGWLLSRLPAGS